MYSFSGPLGVRLAGGRKLALLVGLAFLARVFVLVMPANTASARQAEIKADPAEVGVSIVHAFVGAALGAVALALAMGA